jgi:transcriptional regulator GlxA family with amidase domain
MPALDDAGLFADTVAWLRAHLDKEVTVADLAARAAMSPRTFARRFVANTGTTPYQWIVRERVHLAQRLLETSDLPIEAVAHSSGFCTAGNLRKHFGRVLRTSPQVYRHSFRPAPARSGWSRRPASRTGERPAHLAPRPRKRGQAAVRDVRNGVRAHPA